jgi:hypothetical protein
MIYKNVCNSCVIMPRKLHKMRELDRTCMKLSQRESVGYQGDKNNLELARYGGLYTENPRVAGSIPALATNQFNDLRRI